jgi:uncharacterized membrane protein YjjP (DUF1212 family)
MPEVKAPDRVTLLEPNGIEGPPRAPVRRVVRLALRMGVAMLASGAQTTDTETSLRGVMRALGLPGAEAAVTFSTVSISFVAPGDAQATTAMQMVRTWRPDFSRLAATAALARAIRSGTIDLAGAEATLDRIARQGTPHPRLVAFAAPGVSAAAATILFGGGPADAVATLAIGLAIQPFLARLAASDLPPFFQVGFGVSATAALVVLLVALGLPLQGGLVLTGGVLRFLPGNALVSGMRDLIDRSIVSGTARLAEALLLGGAVAAGAAAMIALGGYFDVTLRLTADGRVDWPAAVTIAAGVVAVVAYAIQLGVPREVLPWTAGVAVVGVAIGAGLVPTGGLDPTLPAALAIGVLGRLAARHLDTPATLIAVPAILPLLPGLTIVQAMLAPLQAVQIALLSEALVTAFAIGVGVASGDIIVASLQRLRERIVEPAVGAFTDGLAALVVGSADRDEAAGPADHDEDVPPAGDGRA